MKITNLSEDTDDFTGNVWHLSNGENVLVDVGTGDSWQNIRELEEVNKVVITHSHYDHVDNLPKVVDGYEPEVYAFEPANLPVEVDRLEDGDELELAGITFQVIHTPGHRDDSICLYSPGEKVLFAGDLLFPEGSFGRTDLEQGDRDRLIESIEKVADLDVDRMYCGHDPAATEDVNRQIQESLEEAKKKEPKY